MLTDKTARIRALNDRLRHTLSDGLLMLTAGVDAGGTAFKCKALFALARFDAFDRDNDPYDEHDFGAFAIEGRRLLFKIDYYADRTLTLGADDPSDERRCLRVLTLMLAEEY